MKRAIPLLALATLSACETIPAAGAGRCDATNVQRFVGALGTKDVGRILLKRSGAKTLRWLAPGTAASETSALLFACFADELPSRG